MRMRRFTLILFAVLLAAFSPASACTIFGASKDGAVLIGNNEDHDDPSAMVWFEPASQGVYGNVTFGFADGYPQGGMNDQGLFYDFFAAGEFRTCPILEGQVLPSGETAATAPDWQALVAMYARYDMPAKSMLQTCATVEEAVTFFRTHYEGVLGYAFIMLADKSGASCTITWNWEKGDLAVNRKAGDFQAIGIGSKAVFDAMNGTGFAATPDFFRDLLKDTAVDITAYSNIYDLKTGSVTVYRGGVFDEAYRFLLPEELVKGRREYRLSDLLPD